ncbi:MAG: hypothetical protein PHX30_04120 [Candidatus Pacebacteria bacterium]|nr:hypothetical protein [Candidatus Paceibacterota bacterium]
MDETKIDIAIEEIKKIAQKGDPAIVWINISTEKSGRFGSHYYKTNGPVLPKNEISLDFTEEETKILMEKLAVVPERFIIFDDESPTYYESQWWSPTNISGATLHHAMWDGEYFGAKSTFIIVGLPDGVCEDSQVVLELIQKTLKSISCSDISGLPRDEMAAVHRESSEKMEYAEALRGKARELKVPEDVLTQLKTDISRKELERLIAHELPWRNTPELISDIGVYVKKIIEICTDLRESLPDEVLPYIVKYSDYVVSRYEKDIKGGNDPFGNYLDDNLKEYKENTIALIGKLEGLKRFISLADNEKLSQRFNDVKAKLLQQWDKKGEKYSTIWGRLKYRIKDMLWF